MGFQKRISVLLSLGVDQKFVPALKIYMDLLWASNEELNLFSRQLSFDELIDNHLIDCILPLRDIPVQIRSIADFGSGGGLPGVVYAILFPGVSVRLFEKSPKKRSFLEKCRSIAPNLEIVGEIVSSQLTGVELVTARAFKPMEVILDLSRDYYRSGGRYFLLKGRKEKVDEEIQQARKKFKDLQVKIRPLHSPVLEVERHLVICGRSEQ